MTTDQQVIDRVRQAAEVVLNAANGSGDVAETFPRMTAPMAVAARAALAMVEQVELALAWQEKLAAALARPYPLDPRIEREYNAAAVRTDQIMTALRAAAQLSEEKSHV